MLAGARDAELRQPSNGTSFSEEYVFFGLFKG
jgi:hypothetical protein